MGPILPGADAIAQAVATDAARVAQKRLHPACASFFVPSVGPPHGVVLLLHGFSAGPWQFSALAQVFSQAHLHTYAARLPGHGACLADGHESDLELPTSAQVNQYAACAADALRQALALAQEAGVPLHLLGFSMGGALALDLALGHPSQIGRLVLVAPLLKPRGQKAWWLFRSLGWLSALGGGGLLDQVPYSWGPAQDTPENGWQRPGHWHFRLGHLYSAISYAYGTWSTGKVIEVPCQLIISDHDEKNDPAPAVALLQKSTAAHFTYCFPAAARVPHAMLTAEENPDAESRMRVQEIALRFLLSGIGVNSV